MHTYTHTYIHHYIHRYMHTYILTLSHTYIHVLVDWHLSGQTCVRRAFAWSRFHLLPRTRLENSPIWDGRAWTNPRPNKKGGTRDLVQLSLLRLGRWSCTYLIEVNHTLRRSQLNCMNLHITKLVTYCVPMPRNKSQLPISSWLHWVAIIVPHVNRVASILPVFDSIARIFLTSPN